MAQICTTREQGKKLQELGVSVDTADMSWHFTNMKSEALQWELKTTRLTTKENFFGKIEKLASLFYKHADGSSMTGEEVFDKIWGKDLPAWSLGALIELMPDKIKGNIFCLVYDLNIEKNHIVYSNRQGDDDMLKYEAYGDLVDCCVEIIEQLTKDGHIKICNND